ncbi:glycoside hydrolase family 20 zincin-like fold domain-containing protein, partial [candidate division KSB1 bacterium]
MIGGGRGGGEAQTAGRYLLAELIDRLDLALPVQYGGPLVPGNRYIVVSSFGDDRLVRVLLNQRGLRLTPTDPGPEGYILDVRKGLVIVGGSDRSGTLYGVQSLLALLSTESSTPYLKGALVRDYPYKPVRGVHVYLPATEDIPFFKRFIRNFLVRYKFNTIFLEVGAGMELRSHPELNLGWERLCRDVFARGGRPVGPENRFQDSVHPELAGGSYLSREEVRDLVRWARKFRIRVVPEIQSLTHAYYLLTTHGEFAELETAE